MIIGNLIGCIFWGALIAIVVTAATYGICRALSRQSVQGPVAEVALIALLVLSGAQCTMITGAVYARDYVEQLAEATDAAASLSQYPQLASLAKKLHIEAVADTSISYVREELTSALGSYITRHALWTLAFVVATLVALAWAGRKSGGYARTTRSTSRHRHDSLMDDRPAHHHRRRH